jgi:hypothetical protein
MRERHPTPDPREDYTAPRSGSERRPDFDLDPAKTLVISRMQLERNPTCRRSR